LRQLDRQFVTIKSGANDLFLLQAGCRSAANPPTCVLQAFNGSLATFASNVKTISSWIRDEGHYRGPLVALNYRDPVACPVNPLSINSSGCL
jgi:hypothetical protein